MFLKLAAEFRRDNWIEYEELQWVGFEYFNREVRLRGRMCFGGLRCGFEHSIAPHGVSSNA